MLELSKLTGVGPFMISVSAPCSPLVGRMGHGVPTGGATWYTPHYVAPVPPLPPAVKTANRGTEDHGFEEPRFAPWFFLEHGHRPEG